VFFEGFVADTLAKMGLNEANVAYVFASSIFTYLPLCFIFTHYLGFLPRKFCLSFAIFGLSFTMFILGPSKLLDLP
jgi:hypothetical protein